MTSVQSANTAKARDARSDLRVKFNLALARVYQHAAHENGVGDCHRLMEEYCDRRENLRIFMSLLTDKTLVVGTSSYVVGKALHASLFGMLAGVFKSELIDPLDKPPSKRKTFDRILTFLTSVFFNETAEKIQSACAISIIEILENVFPVYLDLANSEKLQDVFFGPLFA